VMLLVPAHCEGTIVEAVLEQTPSARLSTAQTATLRMRL
jgi:hypothetical protein